MDVNTPDQVTGQRGDQTVRNDEKKQKKKAKKRQMKTETHFFFSECRIKSSQRDRFSTVVWGGKSKCKGMDY